MIIKAILLILEVLSSFLLICVILVQKSKGGGLSGAAFGGGGGGMGESLFGARAGNVLTRITIALSIFFLGNTLLLAFLYADPEDSSLIKESSAASQEVRPVQPSPVSAPVTAPSAPAGAPLVEGQPMVIPTEDFPAIPPAETPAVEGEITDEPADL